MSTPQDSPRRRRDDDRSSDPDVISVSGSASVLQQVAGSDGGPAASETMLEESRRFETFVTDISRRFLDFVGGDIDTLVDETLCELGQLLKTERAGYLELDAASDKMMLTRMWSADGIGDDASVQYIDLSTQFTWLFRMLSAGEPVVIDRVDQLPEDALNEREYCDKRGIKSFAMVPASLGGVVVAVLALDNFREPRSWNDRILRRMQVIGDIIASAKERAQAQREIADLRQFEQAISEVSAAFVNLPPEGVDEEIENGLGIVAKSLDTDLASMLLPRSEGGYTCAHEWYSRVLPGGGYKGAEVTQESMPWLADRLKLGKPIAIAQRSDLPAEAADVRAVMERVGHEATLFVPFKVQGELAGALAINSVQPKQWSQELVPRLRVLGEVFGQAINRRDAELELRDSFRQIEALKEQLAEENLQLREEVRQSYEHDEIVGGSAALEAALTKATLVAPTDSTVLILGETGTGKELLARAIHSGSARKDKRMVVVNCAALPSNLVEAELFGREKGAFTGALNRQAGRFEIADGSTILLDEIGELSLELQAKLLRVLECGEFERLGSTKTLQVDVRVLASTNRDLAEAVDDGAFREDLYYRLNVFPIEVPPLRDRTEDIPKLVWAFVQEFGASMGKNIESISRETMDALRNYGWPGNVREVRNIIERAMIVSKGPKLEVELPRDDARPSESSRRLADVEFEHISSVLEATGWRIRGAAGAAEILGLKPTTLEARMKKLGLERTASK